MNTRLDGEILDQAVARLERAARRAVRAAADKILPIHTLRIAADQFVHDSVPRAGARALRLLQTFAPDSVVLAQALRLPGYEALPTDPARVDQLLARLESGEPVHPAARMAHDVYGRVHRQLVRQPVQDLRIDFHEAFGRRPDDQEDAAAAAAATELVLALRDGLPCPRLGVRIKPLSGSQAARALRTLDLFVSTAVDRGAGFPETLVVSVPEVTHSEQVSVAAQVAGVLETRLGLARGTLRLELDVSDPIAVFDESGGCQVPALVSAASGRCSGVRIDPAQVARALGSREPASAEPLRDLVRLALAGNPVPLSWGSSPELPHGGRRSETSARFAAIHTAWRAHAESVLRSLREGCFWGWDHDAGQIPARLAAIAVHYCQILPTLRHEMADALARARWGDPPERVGAGQRILDEVLMGLDCGALSVDDLDGFGLDAEDLETRSFRISSERRAT